MTRSVTEPAIAVAIRSCGDRLAARADQAGKDLRRRTVDRRNLQELGVLLPLAREREAQAREAAEAARVPRGELDGGLERDDRLRSLALGLERGREIAPGLRVTGAILGLPSRVRDRLHAGARATEDVADADAARADSEADEAEPEDEREEDEHPLRLLAQAGEHRKVEAKHAPVPGVAAAADDGALAHARRDAVLDAMRQLPDRQREVVALRYYLDLSEADIAETLGISRGAVKSHSSRGLAALKLSLGPLMEDVS